MTDVRDTQQLHAITGRAPATIRLICRDLRGPDGYAYPDALERLDANPGVEVQAYTATEIERAYGIPANAIRVWRSRGFFQAIDRDDNGWPRYLLADVERTHARMRAREARRAQLDL